MNIKHNEAEHRFEITGDDAKPALLEYRLRGKQITLVHTEVPPEMEGKGIGGALAKRALEYAREHDLKVIPSCPFVTHYIERHPEYKSLIAEQS